MKLLAKITSGVISAALLFSCFNPAAHGAPQQPIPSPAKPIITSAARVKKRGIRLRWRAVNDADGYLIYRKSGKSEYEKIASVKKTAYTDKKTLKNKTHKYKIKAFAYSSENGEPTTVFSKAAKTKTFAKASAFSEALVNQTKLCPMLTGHIDADRKAQKILSKIITGDMTNYQKLKAIYSYCALSFSYSTNPKYYITSSDYRKKLYENSVAMDIYYLDRAMTAFNTKQGACTAYSGAFVVLCDLAGFRAYIDEGDIHSKSGGYTGHTWTRVNLGGVYYIFDPQVEQSNMQSKAVPYTYFGQSPKGCDRYRKDENTLKRSIKFRNKAEKVYCGKNAQSVSK